jgi:NADPH:quinone reductase-like Zn-dependent oxidoreductase
MKAVVLHEYGPPSNLKYEDFAAPEPGPGEVLVSVQAVSVNPIDFKMRSGAAKDRFPIEFPAILGRDVAGIVRTLGEGVTGFQEGDRVFALANKTYAELCVVKATDLAKIPEGLEMTTAAAVPLVSVTGEQLIRRGAKVEVGQTIVLTIADTVGHDAATKLLAKVRPGGCFGSVVGPPANAALHPTIEINAFMASTNPATYVHYGEAIRDGKLKLPIDRIMPLEQAAEAQILAEKGGVGKIVLAIS